MCVYFLRPHSRLTRANRREPEPNCREQQPNVREPASKGLEKPPNASLVLRFARERVRNSLERLLDSREELLHARLAHAHGCLAACNSCLLSCPARVAHAHGSFTESAARVTEPQDRRAQAFAREIDHHRPARQAEAWVCLSWFIPVLVYPWFIPKTTQPIRKRSTDFTARTLLGYNSPSCCSSLSKVATGNG